MGRIDIALKLQKIDFLFPINIHENYLYIEYLNHEGYIYIEEQGFTFSVLLNFSNINYEVINLLSMTLGCDPDTIKYSINYYQEKMYLMSYCANDSLEEIKNNLKTQVQLSKHLLSRYRTYVLQTSMDKFI